ncbi:MAG: hypothetical protein ACK5ME_10025 [Parahaliea sp.]
MKLKIWASIACFIASVGAMAQDMARYPLLFKADQGIEVVLAPVEGGQQALVRVSGINHPIDGVVFMTQAMQRGSDGQAWVTTLDGSEFSLLQKQSNRYGRGEYYAVYLPGQRDAVPLYYDEDESKSLSVNSIKDAYVGQQKDGVQARLAQFDRDKRIVQTQTGLDEIDAAASAACGTTVKTVVNWASVNDDQLKRLSIRGYCGSVADELASMCSSESTFKSKAVKLGQVSCQFGAEMKLRAEGDGLEFTTHQKAPNQADFIRQFLRNQ